jgi:hypothetical protein
MMWLTFENPAKSGVVSRWLRDVPSGTACADGIGVRHANQAPIVLAVFILTQMLDGALTYWGVTKFGLGVESNAYLLKLMESIGPGQALIVAKMAHVPR